MGDLRWNSPVSATPPPAAARRRFSRSSSTLTGYKRPRNSTCQPSSLSRTYASCDLPSAISE
ncbi:MAG: hypothetical protein MZV64_23110 [Ignavibacteriales bacterium]|nr:hypothetical protein [Ignavibacteriales bacterium]